MTVSWFGGGEVSNSLNNSKVVSMKEAAKVLYPPKRWDQQSSAGVSRSRFSTLLLEHGEKHIQDWAVIIYTSPTANFNYNSSNSNSNSNYGAGSSPVDRMMNNMAFTNSRGGNKTQHSTQWAQGVVSSPSPRKGSKTSNNSSSHKKKRQQVTKESHPSVHMTKLEGRLHLCSKSLVLEPNDPSRGVVRCPFKKMPSGPPKEYPPASDPSISQTGSFDPMCVEFEASRHWVMRPNHSIGPFESVPVSTTFRLTFLHSSPSTLVELCQELFPLCLDTHHKGSSANHGRHPKELEQLLQPMYDRPFDSTNLVDVRERPLTSNLRCHWLQPLQSQPGCVVVTQERLYFQPATGVLRETAKANHWIQSKIAATARRYHGLQDTALEIYWNDGATSTLLAFERKHEREQVLRLLSPTNVPCHTDREFLLQAVQAWQTGAISNYDYLLLLNSAAGRTLQDLSRYPVFPWVIADWESKKLDLTKESTFRDLTKPVGALNEQRLEYFRHRYESMQDAVEDPFFYGTHYSAAGYILYYLVRSMPEHMLCLQNGKFDAPDRMFHSISKCYDCVLSNHADVKELTPEFYNPNLDYDFLINARGLQLGATQNGDRVNDVTLPPWAKSPRDFLKKNTKALESELCTAMLPRWIDLIFGSKSRGEAAKEACNLFHRYAYFGPADVAAMPTEEERFQAEMHATEFGLVPDQLFVGPHPLRHETVDESFVSPDIGRTFSGADDGGKGDAWELLEPPSNGSQEKMLLESSFAQPELSDPISQPGGSSENLLNRDDRNSFEVENDQTMFRKRRDRAALPLSGTGDTGDRQASGLGAFSYMSKEPTLSNVSSSSGLAAGSPKSTEPTPTPATTNSAEWDIKFIEKTEIHDDAVSGCALIPHGGPNNQSLLASTSLDGGLKVHTVSLSLSELDDTKRSQGITSTLSRFSYITMTRGQSASANQNKITEYRSHTSRDPLACLAIASDGHGGKIAFAGGHDDVVLAYGINSGCAVASVYSHRDAVTGLDMLVRPALMTSTPLWLEKTTHIMVSGSWDATVKVWSVTVANGETVSINREPLAELFDADSSIVCVSAAAVPDDGGIVIGAGCADGSFCVWNLHTDGVKVAIHKEPARRGSGPCSVVKWSCEGGQLHLFTGFATGKVASFTLVDGSMRKASAASVGVAVQCLAYTENILLVGCSDGGLRLIPIRDGAYFTSDLSLWPAVNSKTSPGLSSVNISFAGNAVDGSGKCICCTGAEDGSVALFELKRAARL